MRAAHAAERVPAPRAQLRQHRRHVVAALDRGHDRRGLGGEAEQDRADDPAVGDHELAVAALVLVLEGDHLLRRPLGLEAADRGQLDPDDLEDRHGDRAAVGLLLAERAARRDLGLLDRGRPQPVHEPAVLGDVPGREDRRVARGHHVVDEHAAADVEPRLGGELGVRRDPRAHEQQVGGQRAAVAQQHLAEPLVAERRRGLRARDDAHPQPLEVAAQELRGARVELAPQQPVGALEDRGVQAELVQRVARLEPEQAAARDQRLAAPLALGEGADRERVLGRAHDERPATAEPVDPRHRGARAEREDQPVVGQPLPGAELDLAPLPVDPRRSRVEPRLDDALVVPGVRVEVEPRHRRAAVDQAVDAHAVVQRVRLVGDEVDLALGVAAAHVVGGGDARDPVAEHDYALDRAVVAHAQDLARRPLARLVRGERHRHRALDAAAARHARVLGVPEAIERRALVVGDGGEVARSRP